MPKLPEFQNKPIKGIKEEEWGKMTVGYFNKIEARYASTDYLAFKPELVNELAKPFTSAQQMINFKGEDEKLINAAGRLIQYKGYERPEWFEDFVIQSPEECLKEAKQYNSEFEELPWNLQQKLFRHFTSRELRELLPNIQWKRQFRNDEDWIELLSQFKTAAEMRNTSNELKNALSRLLRDKGVNYPKAYALAESMKNGHTGNRSKRGKYDQRTPNIEQYDLENNLIQVFKTWDDVQKAGFKRSSVAGAIRGSDGHHKHKGYIWKYVEKK